jgi:hypothetical protein
MSTVAVWQSSDSDVLAELGALETQMHSTWAQMLSVVTETESRSMAVGLGYGSTIKFSTGDRADTPQRSPGPSECRR